MKKMKLILIAALAAQVMQPLAAAADNSSYKGTAMKCLGGAAALGAIGYECYRWATQKNVAEQIYANVQEHNASNYTNIAKNIFDKDLVLRISNETKNGQMSTYPGQISHDYVDFLNSLEKTFRKKSSIFGTKEVQTHDSSNIEALQAVINFINEHKKFKPTRHKEQTPQIPQATCYKALLLSSPEVSIIAKISVDKNNKNRKLSLFGIALNEHDNRVNYLFESHPQEKHKPLANQTDKDIERLVQEFYNKLFGLIGKTALESAAASSSQGQELIGQ